MNDMRELKLLHTHYHDRPHLSGPAADYFRSTGYPEALQAIGQDPRELARLTIALLKYIALDPLSGTKLSDFVDCGGDPLLLEPLQAKSATLFFGLPLNRVCNFVGSFSLPASAPETAQLLIAIQGNLGSRMFKAAQLHRRMEKRRVRASARIERKARAAYQQSLDAALAIRPFSRGFSDDNEESRYRDEVYANAQLAYSRVCAPLKDRLQARICAVADQAAAPEYRGSYTDMLTAFALRHIYPASALGQ